MLIEFTKMNGAGNDFILIDNRDRSLSLNDDQVRFLCDRKRGIGADGLLLLEPGTDGKTDWRWQFFNCDGDTAEMCGNGARCFAAFARSLTGESQPISIETEAGIVRANYQNDLITVKLTSPTQLQLHQSLTLDGETRTVHALNTGVPHLVLFVEDTEAVQVDDLGRSLRRHPRFAPAGTNVNFVQITRPDEIRVRTYERGVEDETLACGTGVCAAAMIASSVHDLRPPVSVAVRGGDFLTVDFRKSTVGFENVELTGPAEISFSGTIEI